MSQCSREEVKNGFTREGILTDAMTIREARNEEGMTVIIMKSAVLWLPLSHAEPLPPNLEPHNDFPQMNSTLGCSVLLIVPCLG
jgi:hypothetical protein